ncbi:MAG: hypothetical protein SFT91_04355, partial [Rickettsiaceae bacterium]|nr:hypothetical protein [Rickettsiaceae bacterium]
NGEYPLVHAITNNLKISNVHPVKFAMSLGYSVNLPSSLLNNSFEQETLENWIGKQKKRNFITIDDCPFDDYTEKRSRNNHTINRTEAIRGSLETTPIRDGTPPEPSVLKAEKRQRTY